MKMTNIVLISVVIFAIAVYKTNTNKKENNSAHYINSSANNVDFSSEIELNLDSGEKILLRKSANGFTMQNNAKPTLFVFFTTWCPSCQKSVPFYLDLQKKCSNLRIIGALLEDKDNKTVQKYKKSFGVTYEVTRSGAVSLSKISRKTNLVPSLLLLDKNGLLIHEGILTKDNTQNFLNSINQICS